LELESTNFTAREVDAFLDELFELDRQHLIQRLGDLSARLESLKPRIPQMREAAGRGWSAVEVLAHIAVLSKFYGVLTYRIGTGQIDSLDFLSEVRKRDVLGEQLSRRPAVELLQMALDDLRTTSRYLESTDFISLRRACQISAGRSLTAEEVSRIALCTHLEQHIDQLERSF
jgi:hypothetical protein